MSNVLKALARGGAAETDPNFKQTVLLLHGDGTNGAQNNTFLDSSSNNFTITRNPATGPNAPTQGTFSPFSVGAGEWSNYFDGTGGYLSVASATALNLATGAFTIEGWMNVSATSYMFARRASVAARGFTLYYDTSNSKFTFLAGDTNTLGWEVTITSTNTFATNQWVHVAITRNASNVFTLWINGVSEGTVTSSVTIADDSSNLLIGGIDNTGFYTGYLSNFRVVKGRAVYTSAFTPSTVPLGATSGGTNPPQGTETSLLTCQSNRFVDNGGLVTPNTITRNGDVRVTPFSPFAPTAAYSAGTNGGSGYFDGTGDYLTITSGVTNQFDPGSAFTFECWFYQSSGTSNLCFEVRGTLNSFDASNGILFRVWPNSSGSTFFQFNTAGASTSISTTAPPYNTWVHLAVGYNGTTTRFWVNGVSAGTSTASYTKPTYDRVTIGNSFANANPFFGYLSNMRFVKGSDVYGVSNTTITVPTSPVTAITNTSLLLNFTNAGIIDNTGKNNLETVGNAQIDTAVKKYGTGSLEFDENGDYLTLPSTIDVAFGTGNFTIEMWARFAVSTVGNGQGLFQLSNGYLNSQVRGPAAGCDNATGRWAIYSGTTQTTHGSLVPSTNTWYHVAYVRNSGTTKLYIDGTEIISVADTTNYTDTNFTIAGWYSSGFLLNGYIDDLRITKGVARYPTEPFPTKAFPDL